MKQRLLAALLVVVGVTTMSACGGGGGGGGGGAGAPGLTITPASLPAMTVDADVNVLLGVSGGVPQYTWENPVTGRIAGLTLNTSTGRLTGKPTTAGAATLIVNVSDTSSPKRTGSKTYQVTVAPSVAPPSLTILPASVPSTVTGAAYSVNLTAIGGQSPYTFTRVGATVPGLDVFNNGGVGTISGTPTTAGAFTLTVRATDSTLPVARIGTADYTITVENPPPALSFTTVALPSGTVGVPYTGLINLSGGVAPYNFTQTGGPVPGLTLTNPSPTDFTAGAVLEGTPTTAGTYTYSVQGDDVSSLTIAKSASFQVVINPAGPVTTPELTAKASFSDADVGHLLNRVFWGIGPTQITNVQNAGVSNYIDAMLAKTTNPSIETAAMAEIADPNFPNGYSELPNWWLRLMVKTDNPFQETMAFFWHDLFATGSDVLDQSSFYFMVNHVNMLRANALGNMKTFVYQLSIDAAELEWLNGFQSTKNAPNENFARELWELFTLGADNGYTQTDILQAAKCFTGYRRGIDGTGKATVTFDPARHDTTNKTIFGKTVTGKTGAAGATEYQDVVNLTFDNRPVAEFYAKKLFEYFCYKGPSQAIIDELAAMFRANNYELKPVLKKLLLSTAFYSEQALGSTTYPDGGLMKNPLEFSIGAIRATGLEIPYNTLRGMLSQAGQLPTFPPNVNGWPEGDLWASADGLVQRGNIIHSLITNRSYQTSQSITLDPILPPAGQRSDVNVVDKLAGILNISFVTFPTARNRYIDYLNSDIVTPPNVVSNTFDGSNSTQIDKKVRGLIYIMAQHPSFNVR